MAALTVASLCEAKEDAARTYDAPIDRVYAATVQAVGPALLTAIKEACTVNFRVRPEPYLILFGTAVCRGDGHGKVVVRLSIERSSGGGQIFFVGRERDKVARQFWGGLETALRADNASITSVERAATSARESPVGSVMVKSVPDGADITVDNKFAGSTPATLRLPAGEHALRIANKGFLDWERVVTVTAEGTTTINARLEAAASSGL